MSLGMKMGALPASVEHGSEADTAMVVSVSAAVLNMRS
jgi:hypothetical protein